jgi:hypothetical protein
MKDVDGLALPIVQRFDLGRVHSVAVEGLGALLRKRMDGGCNVGNINKNRIWKGCMSAVCNH